MPMNDFTVGKDIAVDIFDPNAGRVQRLTLRTMFDAKQVTQKVTIKGGDGITRYLELPEGWEGSFEFTRQNSNLDDYILSLEQAYYDGRNVQASQITETITEPNGAITQYRFTGVMFKLSDAGSWKGDGEVKQKLDWCASRRFKN